MNIEETLQETLEELLDKLKMDYSNITISEDDHENYIINISSNDPSPLIGYHGNNIHAIQHILKVICWKKTKNTQFNILLDIDDYRKRREEQAINLTERKIEYVRQNGRPQHLPAMSPYLRRKVHLHCMSPGFEDIETISQGENDKRHIIIKLK